MKGNGRIFLRNGSRYFQIAYYIDGKEYRESTKCIEEKEAEKHLRKRLREKAVHEETGKGFLGPAQKRVRVGEMLDALEKDCQLRGLRALPKLKSHLAPVREAFDDWRAVKLTPAVIDGYVEERLRQGKAPATINREIQLLSQALRLAVRRNILGSAFPVRRLREAGARQGFFEHADFKSVLEHLPPYLQDFARWAYLTGMRKSEIASLTWADVDRQGCVVRLRPEASKNGRGRVLALEGEVWTIVERRWAERFVVGPSRETRLSNLVFHRRGRAVGDFRKAWLAATKETGLEGKLFHDLRRTAIRNMVRAGVPERVAMEISGHCTRHVFDRYNIVNEADLRAAMRKTQDYLAAAESKPSVLLFPKAQEAQA